MDTTAYATKQDVKEIVNGAVTDLATVISDIIAGLGSHMDERFNKVEARLDDHDRKFEQIDQRFEQIDQRFMQIDQRFDAVDKRFEQMEQRFNKVAGLDVKVKDVEMLTQQR